MQHKTTRLAIAVALAVAAGAANAQQHQQFGRDSVYSVPGASSSATGHDSAYPAPSNDPSAAGSVTTGGSAPHFGRDSVYVSQMPQPTTRVSASAPGPQRFGRDSLYAGPFQSRPAPGNDTAVGSTNDSKGKGG